MSLVAAYSLALLGIGTFVGWRAAGQSPAGESAAAVATVPVADYLGAEAAAVMPDVRGLSEANARAALADAGVTVIPVISTRGSAGAPGLVIAQDPGPGASATGTVSLVVSSPAQVPNVLGQAEADAYQALSALGTRVETQRRYVAGSSVGTVLATVPKAGQAVPESVTLVVSEPPGSVFLTQLSEVDGSSRCSQQTVVLAGQQSADSQLCSAGEEPRDYTWLLGGKASVFQLVVGVPDDGPQTARASVVVLLDGKVLSTTSVAYRRPRTLDLPVARGTQLTIRITGLGIDPTSFASVDVALFDARLLGDAQAIATLAGWSR